jgi:SAM-dependent methyltransferase
MTSRQLLAEFAIWECRDCTHRFIKNAPSDDELKAYYNEVHSADARLATPPGPSWRDRALARTVTGLLPPNARVLDIGSSFGETLLSLPGSYHLEGVELSVSAASTASRNPRLTIYNGFFDDIEPGLQRGSYDCVIALAVIEHIRSPIDFLARITRLLRPGGVAVLMTGDYATWNVKHLGESWALYHATGHLHFFSDASLKAACASVGLGVYAQVWAGPNAITSRLPGPVGRLFHCQTTSIAFPWLFGRRPLGDLIYTWCQKTQESRKDRAKSV